jgi:hypothetical protein
MDPTLRSFYRPDHDLDPLDPFYSLLLGNPDLPRLQCGLRNTRFWVDQSNGFRAFGSEIPRESFEDGLHSDPSLLSGVLMIKDIDNEAIFTLIDAFPDLELLFLHQHVARFEDLQTLQDGNARFRDYVDLRPPADLKVSRLLLGMHLDIHCSPRYLHSGSDYYRGPEGSARAASEITIGQSMRYRIEGFISDGSTWRRSSTRISCCMLTPELCISSSTSSPDTG